ncbi:MAG: stage V sporulation protein AD [Erysipelotrichaceae bacterium]|nr:stage V sporulation protein AD [Erysipelotrichaceae bacterium]
MKNILITFNEVYLNETSIVTSKKESKYLDKYIDYIYKDELANEDSYEQAEAQFLKTSLLILYKKTGNYHPEIYFGGDLTSQLFVSHQVGMQLDSSFVGVYSACATLILSMILSSIFVSNKIVNNSISFTSSNYGSAERQFRYPLDYGGQKKDTTTITSTGAVSCLISNKKSEIRITKATIGKIEDISWSDALDMGSPMAYAAYRTIKSHFENTKTTNRDYDLILTGDLSSLGSKVLIDLFKYEGIELYNHLDCGKILFGEDKRYFCGGSGCACIGIVGFSYLKKMIEEGNYKKVLLVGTGSLHSKISVDQKEDIPLVSHCIELEVLYDLSK